MGVPQIPFTKAGLKKLDKSLLDLYKRLNPDSQGDCKQAVEEFIRHWGDDATQKYGGPLLDFDPAKGLRSASSERNRKRARLVHVTLWSFRRVLGNDDKAGDLGDAVANIVKRLPRMVNTKTDKGDWRQLRRAVRRYLAEREITRPRASEPPRRRGRPLDHAKQQKRAKLFDEAANRGKRTLKDFAEDNRIKLRELKRLLNSEGRFRRRTK